MAYPWCSSDHRRSKEVPRCAPPRRFFGPILIAGSLAVLMGGTAMATNYLYATNSYWDGDEGSPGFRFTLSSKALTLNGHYYAHVPCRTASVCQTRGTILNLTFDPEDQCALTYDPDTEVLLSHVSGVGLPTCTNTPALEDCDDTCKPHTIDFDHDLYPGWLFVSLTQKAEIVAVRTDAYADQAAVVRALSNRNFEPRDHAVVGE